MQKKVLPGVGLAIASLAPALFAAEVATPPQIVNAAGRSDPPFFPFCIDWHDAKKRCCHAVDQEAADLSRNDSVKDGSRAHAKTQSRQDGKASRVQL